MKLYAFLLREPAASAVRARRRVLAGVIDRVADERCQPRILSVAAGHLREADLSWAVQERQVGEIVALDQDSLSLAEITRCYGHLRVRTHHSSIRPLLTGKHDLGTFDLAYAAGLYDYLNTPTAARLTENLFALLRPGGRLLVANFVPAVPAIGYMESYMAWRLIYRTEAELAGLAAAIPRSEVASSQTFVEEERNVAFLLLARSSGSETIA
ncbi:MAG: class I SAM-dependent methyltransferase [Gemmataceae bacterium]|nr:class I SAM-dependent methyltransferase [Gemmataceae bacterium]